MSGHVEVWICPRCGSYYGASEAHGKDLRSVMNQRRTQDGGGPSHSRAKCPRCVPPVERELHFLRAAQPEPTGEGSNPEQHRA